MCKYVCCVVNSCFSNGILVCMYVRLLNYLYVFVFAGIHDILQLSASYLLYTALGIYICIHTLTVVSFEIVFLVFNLQKYNSIFVFFVGLHTYSHCCLCVHTHFMFNFFACLLFQYKNSVHVLINKDVYIYM